MLFSVLLLQVSQIVLAKFSRCPVGFLLKFLFHLIETLAMHFEVLSLSWPGLLSTLLEGLPLHVVNMLDLHEDVIGISEA